MEQTRLLYQCQRLEVHRGKDRFSYTGDGGSLVQKIEELGLRSLIHLLTEAEALTCVDQHNVLQLTRDKDSVLMSATWADGTTYQTTFPFVPASPQPSSLGPVSANPASTLSPSPSIATSERPSVASLSVLEDVDQAVWVKDGSLYTEYVSGSSKIPKMTAQDLGRSFCRHHNVDAPYIAGAMAGGIASVDLVRAMSQANLLSFFGAGGLPIGDVAQALESLSGLSGVYGCNLLSNPHEPQVEEQTVDLYLQHEVRYVSASAYIRLSTALVRYRLQGISEQNGRVHCPNRVFAKVSHPSVAERFLRPPPEKLVQRLVQSGVLSPKQAELARRIPMAEDITIEADSGGHTDGRPLSVILPALLRLRDRICAEQNYDCSIRVGAAGGLGDPSSISAAFAMGAAYVLLGSVHQSCLEAGTSAVVKEMLGQTTITDCAMGAAPDMFEQGAHVQVLSKGTLYATRSNKLRDVYRRHESIDSIPEAERAKLERTIFQRPLDEVWTDTKAYWQQQDPTQVQKALDNPKHQMALVFRWYLGLSSRWARSGQSDRKRDYQVWCGPSMGLFNQWAEDTVFADVQRRNVVAVARALLTGTLVHKRKSLAALYGVSVRF